MGLPAVQQLLPWRTAHSRHLLRNFSESPMKHHSRTIASVPFCSSAWTSLPERSCPSFMDFVEWVLVSCKSLLTIGPIDDDTSPTDYPVPSQNHSDCKDCQHEPTTGHKRYFTMTFQASANESDRAELHHVVWATPVWSGVRADCTICRRGIASGIRGYGSEPHQPSHCWEWVWQAHGRTILIFESLTFCLLCYHLNLSVASLIQWSRPTSLSRMFLRLWGNFGEFYIALQTLLQSPATPATQSSLPPISPSVSP